MKKTFTCFLAMSWLLVARGQQAGGPNRDPEKPNKTQRVLTIKPDDRTPENTINQLLHPGNNQTYQKVKTKQDKSLGLVTDVYRLYYKGVPVEESEIRVVNQNGKPKYVLQDHAKITSDINVKPRISEAKALGGLLSKYGAKRYAWQDPQLEKGLKERKNDRSATYYPKGELVILPESGKLAYKFEVFALEPYSQNEVYVDALGGEILKQIKINTSEYKSESHYPNPKATTNSQAASALQSAEIWVKVNTQELSTVGAFDNSTNSWILHDIAGNIHTRKIPAVEGKFPGAPATEYSTQETAGAGVGDFRQYGDNDDWVATRMHLGVENAYSYYLSNFNRLGFNGALAPLNVYVYNAYGSSFYDRANSLFFPYDNNVDDEGAKLIPRLLTAYHEYAHAFTVSESGLVAQFEPGSLNEALSDIWSYTITDDFFKKNPNIGGNFDPQVVQALFQNDWITRVGNTAFEEYYETSHGYSLVRDAKNPHNYNYPAFYQGNFYGLHEDEHFNSTVVSHWYYLLSEGASVTLENDPSTVVDIQAIGIQEAAKIIYLTTTNLLGKFTDYKSFALQTTLAAKILFGENANQVKSVQNAWKAVGLGDLDFSSNLACTPPADESSDFFVQDFKLINIQNSKPKQFTSAYRDYTYLTINAEKGQQYDLYLKAQGKPIMPHKLYWSIWIDADSSRTFEPTEKVFSDESSTIQFADGNSGSIYKGLVTMPVKTPKDTTYLRVVLSAEPDASPCYEKNGKAQKYIEDYGIVLSRTCTVSKNTANSDFKDLYKDFEGVFLDTIRLVECGDNQLFKITPPSNLNYIDMSQYQLKKGVSYSLEYNFKKKMGTHVSIIPENEDSPNNFVNTCSGSTPVGFNNYTIDEKHDKFTGGSHEIHNTFLVDNMASPKTFNSVVWVDFNRNGVFEDMEGFGSKWDKTKRVFYVNFLVPDWALTQKGNTTIRINNLLANAVFLAANACSEVTAKVDPTWPDDNPIILYRNGMDIEMNIQDGDNMFKVVDPVEKQSEAAPGSAEASLDPVSLNLYPNPATDMVDLSVKGTSADNFTLELYDSAGMRLMIKQPWDGRALDISKYPNGIYVLTLRRDREVYSQKLIIQR